jgi:hypothetical protein
MTNAVVVLTARGPDKILAEGGSQNWRLNEDRARKSEYLVCVQNRHNGNWGSATEPHGTAFLIGRITEIVPSPEEPQRWLIKIGQYAKINVPNVWQSWRFPVRYMSLEELGIDPEKLEFETLEGATHGPQKLGDVIDLAKQQIAAFAGVPVGAVRISVDLS